MLRTCCGCCELKVGSIIVGSIYMALTLLGTIALIVLYCTDARYLASIFQDLVSLTTSITLLSFLLYGASKEQREFMLPWIIVFAIGLVYASIALIIATIFLSVYFFIGILIVTIMWYGWVVVYSHWTVLGESSMPVAMSAIAKPNYHGGQSSVVQMEQQQPLYPTGPIYPNVQAVMWYSWIVVYSYWNMERGLPHQMYSGSIPPPTAVTIMQHNPMYPYPSMPVAQTSNPPPYNMVYEHPEKA